MWGQISIRKTSTSLLSKSICSSSKTGQYEVDQPDIILSSEVTVYIYTSNNTYFIILLHVLPTRKANIWVECAICMYIICMLSNVLLHSCLNIIVADSLFIVVSCMSLPC